MYRDMRLYGEHDFLFQPGNKEIKLIR
jgi:hypothetical protein